jgi:two-component system response regulator
MNSSPSMLPPILAIDDSPDDLFFLERLIKKSGTKFPLITFTDANAAVAYLTDAAKSPEPGRIPCFIFTDLRMPQMNGLEFLQWIRTEKMLNRLPVVMLTTSDEPEDMKRAKELGVDRYYVKFPSKEEIAALLEQAGEPHRAG